jgi:hypothetical protein
MIGYGNLSIANSVHISSSLSMRSVVFIGSGAGARNSCSVFDFMAMGSALSIRSYTRAGSFVSMREKDSLGNRFVAGQMSMYHYVQLASSVSVRSFVRSGSTCSALRFTHIGSSVSLRSFYRVGESVSVIDFVNLSSNISIRSFMRLGSTLSAFGNGILRVGAGKIELTSGTDLKFYATSSADRSMTVTGSGGKLHGTWTYETSFTQSDRRLKTDIEPLVKNILRHSNYHHRASTSMELEALSEREYVVAGERKRNITSVNVAEISHHAQRAHSYSMASSSLSQTNSRAYLPVVASLMRQLRPVSFRYKNNSESKFSRYGFIAQELETLIPSVIYTDRSTDLKFVRYHDLLAILSMGMQNMDAAVDHIEIEINDVRGRINSDYKTLNPKILSFENALVQLLRSALGSGRKGDAHGLQLYKNAYDDIDAISMVNATSNDYGVLYTASATSSNEADILSRRGNQTLAEDEVNYTFNDHKSSVSDTGMLFSDAYFTNAKTNDNSSIALANANQTKVYREYIGSNTSTSLRLADYGDDLLNELNALMDQK